MRNMRSRRTAATRSTRDPHIMILTFIPPVAALCMNPCMAGLAQSFGFDEAFLEQAYADSREEFPGGWKTGDACFMVTNRKNGCTGNYTVLGFDGRYFTLQNSRGSRYRASAGRMFRSRAAALAPKKENTESGGNHDERNR